MLSLTPKPILHTTTTLLLTTFSLLYNPPSIFAQVPPYDTIVNPAVPPQIGQINPGDPAAPATTVAIFIARFLAAALSIGAILFLLYLVWGTYKWLTSGGDKNQLAIAQQHIAQAIIGLILLASTFAITNIIGPLLGIDFLSLSWPTF